MCVMKHTKKRGGQNPTPITLRELRTRAGYTQVEFAAIAGIKRARLSKIETNGSPMVRATTSEIVTANLRKNHLLFTHEIVSFAPPAESTDATT